MRFAITATDRYQGVVEAFIQAGWQPLKLFTTPVDQRLHHNKGVIELAARHALPVQISRIQPADLDELASMGCEALIVASYAWKIPPWEGKLPYAINFHPAPLPFGRGPYPAVRAILECWPSWAVSCHKLTPEFDAGDVLAQDHFALDHEECHERIDLKIQLSAKRLATQVAAHFPALWQQAVPQGVGTYWPMFTEADRTLDFTQPVEALLRRVRAFGNHECIANLAQTQVFVRRAVGWRETHGYAPGTVIHQCALEIVIAVQDGFIGLVEWSLVGPDAVMGRIGR